MRRPEWLDCRCRAMHGRNSVLAGPVVSRRDVFRQCAGFSLIEVLIALSILSLGAASLLALYAAAANTHRRSVDRTHTSLVAEEVLGLARAVYRVGMSSQDIVEAVHRRLPPDNENCIYELKIYKPEGDNWALGQRIASVRVRWRHLMPAKETSFDSAEPYTTVLLPRHVLGEAAPIPLQR